MPSFIKYQVFCHFLIGLLKWLLKYNSNIDILDTSPLTDIVGTTNIFSGL